jgi:hypothetical protein
MFSRFTESSTFYVSLSIAIIFQEKRIVYTAIRRKRKRQWNDGD